MNDDDVLFDVNDVDRCNDERSLDIDVDVDWGGVGSGAGVGRGGESIGSFCRIDEPEIGGVYSDGV